MKMRQTTTRSYFLPAPGPETRWCQRSAR